MSTIAEILEDHCKEMSQDIQGLDVLTRTLVAREQEMVGTLQEVATKFGLLPAIVAKVIQNLGLGEEPSEEQRVYVDAQYALLIEQIKAQREQAIAAYRERGMIVEVPEFVDPLSEEAGETLVIPDTPPEA